MIIDRDIVRFCSIECKLQMSGELSVGWMVDAWLYAQEASKIRHEFTDELIGYTYNPTLADVLNIGKLVEPNVNYNGFRKVDVRVGWDVKMNWENVPRAMDALMESLTAEPDKSHPGITIPVMTPDKFFKEYEDIHPWRDGNGRSGVILFNWINGTLDDPQWAPNFWNDNRRTIGYGAS